MADLVADELAALANELASLETKFLSPYFPVNPEEHTPDVFNHDVKAYCVLCHAAFEEFLEFISETMMKRIETEFMSKKITLSTACFLMSWGAQIDLQSKKLDSCFDLVRTAISEAKDRHSAALKDNHGFSKKYMQTLLVSVGLNLPDQIALGSVVKLADARGTFAHSRAAGAKYGEYKKANRQMAPEEAKSIVADCSDICKDIALRTSQVW